MKLLYEGKTEDVFQIEPEDQVGHTGKYALLFKDSATGYIVDQGKPTERLVFDSGYDTVVGEIPGKGVVDCQATSYFSPCARCKRFFRKRPKQLHGRAGLHPVDLPRRTENNQSQELLSQDRIATAFGFDS